MIAEPYICIKGWNTGSIYWLAKHPDGKLFALTPRHNSCDLVVYDQIEWLPYADFEREKLKRLKGFMELSALESLRAGYSFYFIGKGHRASYSSEGLIDYRFYDYEHDSESNRLLKRAEFLRAVCEREGIPWTEEKGECCVCRGPCNKDLHGVEANQGGCFCESKGFNEAIDVCTCSCNSCVMKHYVGPQKPSEDQGGIPVVATLPEKPSEEEWRKAVYECLSRFALGGMEAGKFETLKRFL